MTGSHPMYGQSDDEEEMPTSAAVETAIDKMSAQTAVLRIGDHIIEVPTIGALRLIQQELERLRRRLYRVEGQNRVLRGKLDRQTREINDLNTELSNKVDWR